MAYFPDVTPGEGFVPSVLRENNLRHMLNTLNSPSSRAQRVLHVGNHIITVFNNSGATIGLYTPVAFTARCEESSLFDDDKAFFGRVANEDDKIWGVAQREIVPMDSGPVLLSGATWAELKPGTPKDFVTVGVDECMEFADEGRAQVIWGDTYGHGLILLGGGGGGSVAPTNEYTGQFKIQRHGDPDDHLVDIIDGRYPYSGYCGYTDIPDCEAVDEVYRLRVAPGKNIEFEFNWSPDENRYRIEIHAVTGRPTGDRSVSLGYVDSDNNIIQQYRNDNTMIWSDRYFL